MSDFESKYSRTAAVADVLPDLSTHINGKVVLVTGVTPSSLGAKFVTTIAAHSPKLIILAGRKLSNLSATAEAIASVNPKVATRELVLDLGDQKKVRKAAEEVLGYAEEAIDVVLLNAAIMATPYATTPEGIESQFGTNHIGHFLFTNLIMPKILKGQGAAGGKTTGGRVVVVSSDGYALSHIRFKDLGFMNGEAYRPWQAYGQSKSANALFAVALAEKLASKGLVATSVHPGVIGDTGIAKHLESFDPLYEVDRWQGKPIGEMQWSTIEQGMGRYCVAAFDPEVARFNGRYFEECRPMPPNRMWSWARDPVDAQRLWEVSEELVGQKFEY